MRWRHMELLILAALLIISFLMLHDNGVKPNSNPAHLPNDRGAGRG
jgi:hypothetical protein